MDEQLKHLVNMLKEKISSNLKIIKANEEEIREILKQPVSADRSSVLAEMFNKNKNLLEENHDSLNLELQLITYLNKYKQLSINATRNLSIENALNQENSNKSFAQSIEANGTYFFSNEDELLERTLKGEIPYNASHPKFDDEDFFNNLLECYKQNENYEMCSVLIKLRPSK